MTKKIVLVGRPNVGKSTLFNRLSISERAIVHNQRGVTRDRKYSSARIGSMEFDIIDTPGLEEKINNALSFNMMVQTNKAICEADLVLLIIDYLDGVTLTDKFFSRFIRKMKKQYIIVVNKVEKASFFDKDYYNLGSDNPIAISAKHGQGLADLYQVINDHIIEKEDKVINNCSVLTEEIKTEDIKIIIVGRPNVGKSTIINKIVGSQRVLTGNEIGITRESISILWKYKDYNIKLIDTAGLRKASKIVDSLEKLSVTDTIKNICFSHIVVFIMDASIAFEKQDLTIINYAISEGRGVVVVINKCDLIRDMKNFIKEIQYKLSHFLSQLKKITILYISAINNDNILSILDQSIKTYQLWNFKITTSKLNNWLVIATKKHPLPIKKKWNRKIKLKYITQINIRPPTFKIFCNDPSNISNTYKNYLLTSLREEFNLLGIPIRMYFSKTSNPYVK